MGRTTYYYDVIPATAKFRGIEGLTYSSPTELSVGQLVSVDFRGYQTQAVVVAKAKKPDIKIKDLTWDENIILPKQSVSLLIKTLAYYPGYAGATAQLFAPSFAAKIKKSHAAEESSDNIDLSSLPQLTDEQALAYKEISGAEDSKSTFLLHGETGSGKTRVYIELAKDAISRDKSVLILTPEISLTTPLASQFREIFGNKVFINHSSLTPKQRLEIWAKLLFTKDPIILIGPRSSLFIPFSHLGLIIVDEFHEPAYKQESAPFYNAVRIASILASESSAKLILGSATPSINEYFLAENKNIPILRMTKQAITKSHRTFESKIIDLSNKNERSAYPLISNTLIRLLKDEIENNRQSLLFINKRGSARTIACQNCGWRALCPNCDLPLVYHGDQNLIRCHTCGFNDKPIYNCPECKSPDVQFKSPGTKTIVEQLKKTFPGSNILRFDKDNKKDERLENNYEDIKSGNVNIIVGTQLLIKGHDLPNLGLVAMLQADSSLNFPDFSSEERSFQMIRQLSGRVGRGHGKGKVIIQTFEPNNHLIEMALNGSWQEFYESQIKQRKNLGFPPFYHALKIEASRKTRKSAEASMDKLATKINQSSPGVKILGPSPSFIEKKNGSYCWQIIVKSRERSDLCNILLQLSGNYKANIDPGDFL
ncbi:primosomal protein N' [Candidatus Saccharibacteria bacterium]|nr:primosomal protein N' [Candidatus Saccharibacteria bacterium]